MKWERKKGEIQIRVIADELEEARHVLEEIRNKGILPTLEVTGLHPSQFEYAWRGYGVAKPRKGEVKNPNDRRRKE